MLALQARRPVKPKPKRGVPGKRRTIDFSRLVKRVADRFGAQAASAWTKATLGYQAKINETALKTALASKNIHAIEGVVGPTKLQQAVAKVLVQPLTGAAVAVGKESARTLAASGIQATFNATHPNVVAYARNQAAELVAGVPKEVKQVIAEVVARGAERGLTVAEQARAIREVVGLPPHWAGAPGNLAADLRSGRIAAATSRRMSAVLKQQIRSAAANDTMTEAFIKKVQAEYSASLINARALTIARTETQRASNFGLAESWDQAKTQGVLPATSRMYWIVTPDDRLCPICVRIPAMNPDGRALGDGFMTPEGVVDLPPAPHPNCRCAVGLGFGDTNPIVSSDVAEAAQPLARIVEPVTTPSGMVRGALAQAEAFAAESLIKAPLYHGTASEATIVKKGIRASSDEVNFHPGISLTTDASYAADYAGDTGKVLEFRANIKNPITQVELDRLTPGMDVGPQQAWAQRHGYDAIVGPGEVRVFDPGKLFLVEPKAEAPKLRISPKLASRLGPPPATGVGWEVKQAVEKVLTDMKVSPKVVTYSRTLGKSQVGTMRGDIAGLYKNGKIKLDPTMSISQIKETVAHEANHLKFDAALQADKTLARDIFRDYEGLKRDDGVTAYSIQHWDRSKGLVEFPTPASAWATIVPVDETLAEIRALRAVGRDVGSARYKKLMKRVDKAYEQAVKKGLRFRGGRPVTRIIKAKPLTTAEKDALKAYQTESQYLNINPLLREGKQSYIDKTLEHESNRAKRGQDFMTKAQVLAEVKESERLITLIDSAMEKAGGKTPAVVYRGIKAIPDWKVGQVITDKGYVSTSTSKKVGKSFASWGTELEIRLPSGQRGLLLKGSGSYSEKEFLLPRGTKFRVVSRSEKKIVLEVVQ